TTNTVLPAYVSRAKNNYLWRFHRWSSLLCSSLRSTSSKTGGRSEPAKQSLKKPKLPVGRFDEPEESNVEREPLEKFPDGINPATKERGGPKGPEPTRFGDWERKGRCIDF
uniref:Succinate dehydrogenase assembly factor 4, mitochondrial n=1 Tax=Athene cunicularia TaxID=194338 RepID=A0A663NA95_ATHCN